MGQGLSPPLRQLDDFLSDLPAESDAMMLSELDGFLTGIAVCPAPILAEEWLPLVWGGSTIEDAGTVALAGDIDLDAFRKLIIEHYNTIGLDLSRGPGHFSPVYDVDERNDDVLWEIWISGFARAMALRPNSWARIADSGEEDAVVALAMLIGLVGIDSGDAPFTQEQIDEIIPMAPDMIPFCIDALHGWRAGRDAPKQPGAVSTKIGGNDPCYCGSGRIYKKCCGAN
jgi:uncharacterized protein